VAGPPGVVVNNPGGQAAVVLSAHKPYNTEAEIIRPVSRPWTFWGLAEGWWWIGVWGEVEGGVRVVRFDRTKRRAVAEAPGWPVYTGNVFCSTDPLHGHL